MPTYSEEDLQRIAVALGVEVGAVERHSGKLESAARWYGLDRGELDSPRRPSISGKPSARRTKLKKIAASARALRDQITSQSARIDRIAASRNRLLRALDIEGSSDG